MKGKVFILEDDLSICGLVKVALEMNGLEFKSFYTLKSFTDALAEERPDVALLDIMLPDGNGLDALRIIKSKYPEVSCIMLSALSKEEDKVNGLNSGADDYIAKPFRPRELISRIHNIMRRYGKSNALLEYRNLTVDVNRGAVLKDGQEILLSALEYRLLLYFMNNKDIVLSRSRLLDALWDMAGEFVNDNTLTVYIKRLREKIEEDPQNPLLIKTIRGMGYKMGD